MVWWLAAMSVLALGFRRLRWSEFEEGRKLRYFVFFSALILAWAFSTYDYNYYFDQPHLADRALLIVFAFLVLLHPGFVPLFLLEAIVIAYQFHLPLGGTWTDKKVVFDALVLFNLFLLAKLVIRKDITRRFLFFAMCLLATHYFGAGMAKHEIGWLGDERLDNLVAASYSNGWFYFLSESAALRVVEIVKFLNFPMILGAFLIEVVAGADAGPKQARTVDLIELHRASRRNLHVERDIFLEVDPLRRRPNHTIAKAR